MLRKVRSTEDDKTAGVVRIVLGFLFLATGSMKLLVPMLWRAWSGQLTQAGIPFYTFNLWFVPVAEILTGVILVIGFFTRLGSLVVIIMMMVATYVHLVVEDPSFFPLQPEEPIIPIFALAMAVFVVWRGGGAWSLDLRSFQVRFPP